MLLFFNDTATTEIYTLSLHDALPIYQLLGRVYGVPLSPRQLLHAPRPMVHDRIDRAVDQAVEAGATVGGLGALTDPAVSGGGALRDRTDIGGTNGKAVTAARNAQGGRRGAEPG